MRKILSVDEVSFKIMENMGFEESTDVIERLKRETERLKRRDLERHLEIEKKREEREEKSASSEKLDLFIETLDDRRLQIEKALELVASGSIDKSELPYHFDGITKSIQNLQNYISQSTYFLRVYDIRKSQEALQALQQKCQELEEWLLPKKKFSFKVRKSASKSKKEPFTYEVNDIFNSKSPLEARLTKTLTLPDDICGFTQRVGENLSLNSDVIFKKDVVLSHLENCTVRLPGVPSTLHITNLCKSRVLCGPVATSIFIEDCIDCIFVLTCQQLRIHSTKLCNFYLHVTCRSIIEDTKEVGFAPYHWKYEDMERHFQLAGLDINKNNWDFIDDFNWLACDKPSPHWHVLKDYENSLDWI